MPLRVSAHDDDAVKSPVPCRDPDGQSWEWRPGGENRVVVSLLRIRTKEDAVEGLAGATLQCINHTGAKRLAHSILNIAHVHVQGGMYCSTENGVGAVKPVRCAGYRYICPDRPFTGSARVI